MRSETTSKPGVFLNTHTVGHHDIVLQGNSERHDECLHCDVSGTLLKHFRNNTFSMPAGFYFKN